MDQTQRPFKIPPEYQKYAEEHEIFELLKRMTEHLLVSKPEDPLSGLVYYLKNLDSTSPRVIILGPPASGKRTLAKQLAKTLSCLHLTTESVFAEAPAELKSQAQEYQQNGEEIPDALWAQIFKAKISTVEAAKRGYIMDDFPKTKVQALELQAAGVFPRQCIVLTLPDPVCIERAVGKRVDPITGEIYHSAFSWPSDTRIANRIKEAGKGYTANDMIGRLLFYRRHSELVINTFGNSVKVIDADQPAADICSQALAIIKTRDRSFAPFTPRVILIGPPGSGKTLQAALLASKYNLVNVSMGQIIKEHMLNETNHGISAKRSIEQRGLVSDTIVTEMLEDRLNKPDCIARGWVLTGYPRTRDQAELLESSGLKPNRVFFLDLPLDAALERVSQQVVDPITGQTFHLALNPPRTLNIAVRLTQRPKDREEVVRRAYAAHKAAAADLRDYYASPNMYRVNAEADPHGVFEIIEARIVSKPPLE